ncbi:LAMI_0H01046g1_1 [Lachancea mirantina]|uniref:Phosphotransferase n=1 Tax=Lachancea mirantina TaxID=1230905 RepID=A0A1G4KDL7_9SACH|nr:LAMI_0H01046g1_1 [Lachancea mirantina]
MDSAILGELELEFAPNQNFENVVRLGKEELLRFYKESDCSMLPCGKAEKVKHRALDPNTRLLSLDVGGSVLKMAIVSPTVFDVVFSRTKPLSAGTVDESFFANIAEWSCVQARKYAEENCIPEKDLSFLVGVTFSFPLTPNNELITMSKGFDIATELKGVNLLQLLRRQFSNIQMDCAFSVRGIINDSVAVYLTNSAYGAGDDFTLIVGTGTNACLSLNSADESILINAELGFLGKDFIRFSKFDLFDSTAGPNLPLERVTAGKCVPQVLKRVLDYYKVPVSSHCEFNGKLLSNILEEKDCHYFGTRYALVKEITKILLRRASFYLSAALMSIAHLTGKANLSKVRVGFVGSFLANITFYQEMTQKFAGGKIQLHYLRASHLKGAAIHTYNSL